MQTGVLISPDDKSLQFTMSVKGVSILAIEVLVFQPIVFYESLLFSLIFMQDSGNNFNSVCKVSQFLCRGVFCGPGQIHAILSVSWKYMKMEMRYRLPSGLAVRLKNCHPIGFEFLLHSFGDTVDDLKYSGGLTFIQIQYRFTVGFQ